jgi:hypothetical protein
MMPMARSSKTRPTSADVEEFIQAIPDAQRRADARALSALLAEVTGEPPVLWGSSIVGFGTYHYRYESGREGTSALAGFSPRKAHLVVYWSAASETDTSGSWSGSGRTRRARGASTSSASPTSTSTCFASSSNGR